MIENPAAAKVGLPVEVEALLFDMDGVLVDTEEVHAQAWAEAIDDFLRERARSVESQPPFDRDREYPVLFAGRPAADGLAAFLQQRQIDLPVGSPSDVPGSASLHGVVNRKERYFDEHLRADGISVYGSSVEYVRIARAAGLPIAVVSSSSDARGLLGGAGIDIDDLFDVVIDAHVAADRHLRGKPSPDPYLVAAEQLRVPPPKAAVFEDAVSGVAAGRAGNFGCVVGIDRGGDPDSLLASGATIVVSDLSDLLVNQ